MLWFYDMPLTTAGVGGPHPFAAFRLVAGTWPTAHNMLEELCFPGQRKAHGNAKGVLKAAKAEQRQQQKPDTKEQAAHRALLFLPQSPTQAAAAQRSFVLQAVPRPCSLLALQHGFTAGGVMFEGFRKEPLWPGPPCQQILHSPCAQSEFLCSRSSQSSQQCWRCCSASLAAL